MLLKENTRLTRGVRAKIQYLLRSLYNRLLVERVPSRILVTINEHKAAEQPATRSSGAPSPRDDDGNASGNLR